MTKHKHTMTLLLLNTIVFLFAGLGCLIVGGIVLNAPPLHDPPGFARRVSTYLNSNIAETKTGHDFPELELRCYRLAPAALFAKVEHALALLDWKVETSQPERFKIHAVVTTKLLNFRDDIEIELRAAACGTELHIRSQSRVGRGDLAANTRHILDLYQALARQA